MEVKGGYRVNGVDALARLFGVSDARVRNWMANGMPHVRQDGAPAFNSAECVQWLARQMAYAVGVEAAAAAPAGDTFRESFATSRFTDPEALALPLSIGPAATATAG